MGRTRKISETKEQIDKAEELVLRTKKAYDEAVTALKILREKERLRAHLWVNSSPTPCF